MDNWQRRVFPTSSSASSATPLSELGRSKKSECARCGKTVYVTEKIKISHSLCYHPNCFRCLRCQNRLTLKSFKTFTDEGKTEIFCEHHVPLYAGHVPGSEYWGEAGIKQALASQEDLSVYHSTLDLAGHPALSRRQRRALEKRLTYNRRVCKSLSRLNNAYDDFRWARSLSNSCETLSAFSCDDACSDILYLPAGRHINYSPSLPDSPYDDNPSSPVPHFRRNNFPAPPKSPSESPKPVRHTTFSDRVEVIHITPTESLSEEEKANDKSVGEVFDAPNPFKTETPEEVVQYVKAHLPAEKMNSLGGFGADIKFADDSSEDSEKSASESSSHGADRALSPSDLQPTTASPDPRREKLEDMRQKFLNESKLPVVRIVPPTPPVGLMHDMQLAPPSLTPEPSTPGGSSRNSTSSTTYSDSESSSSSGSSDSSSDSSSEDSSSDDEDAPVSTPSSVPAAKPSVPLTVTVAAPPSFVSGVLPKPAAAQLPPRPARPPPPPPASLGLPVPEKRVEQPPPPLSPKLSQPQPLPQKPSRPPPLPPTVLLETDLDAFIDPSVEDIMNDPLLAPVGRIEVIKESTTSETTTKIVTTDPRLPGGSIVTRETVKSVHAPKPIIKLYRPTSSPIPSNEGIDHSPRSSPAQDPAVHELTVAPPAPLILPQAESEASIYVPPAPAPIHLPMQEDKVEMAPPSHSKLTCADPEVKCSAQLGNRHLRPPPQVLPDPNAEEEDEGEENPHLLTAPTWECDRHPSSTDSEKSESETEFPPDLHAEDPTYMDFSLTTTDFDGPSGLPSSADNPFDNEGHRSSSSSSSDSSDSDSDGDEEVYDPYFTQPASSSLPNLLDDTDGEFARDNSGLADDWDSSHGLSDSQVIQISSIDALAKFSENHTDRTNRSQPYPPTSSNRVLIPKGPARSRQVPVVPAINLISVRRSPRLLRKGMTGSLPVIFERPESFGEKDKRRPDFLARTLSGANRASPENVTSPEDNSSPKTAPAAAPSREAASKDALPEPVPLDQVDATSCRTLSDTEGEMMTTDLDDLSPVETKPKVELQETDLDELLVLNEDHGSGGDSVDPFETAIDEDTATPSMGANHFEEDECTTSQSSSCQLGDMEENDGVFPEEEVLEKPPVLKLEEPPALKLDMPQEEPSPLLSPSSDFRSKLASLTKKRESATSRDEQDVAPSRSNIRSLIADLEKRAANREPPPKLKPEILPKPRRSREESPTEKENKMRSEKPSSLSPRQVLKNLAQEAPVPQLEEAKIDKAPAKGEIPEYMNDYVPALMSQVSTAAQIPTQPTVIDVYPVYQQNRPPYQQGQRSQSHSQTLPQQQHQQYPAPPQQFQTQPRPHGPPPPVMPKPMTKPPVMPKPKMMPKPTWPPAPQQQMQQQYAQQPPIQPPQLQQQHSPGAPPVAQPPARPAPGPPKTYASQPKTYAAQPPKSSATPPLVSPAQETPPDSEEVLEMVQDVVQSRKPLIEDEEAREKQRLEDLKKKREEERNRADAYEALRASSKYQRANEIAGNVIEMDRAIDEATGHINSIDNTLDAITGYNMHLMRTLEGMSDGEISDADVENQGVQTVAEVEENPVVPNARRGQRATNPGLTQTQSKLPAGVNVAGGATPSAATATAAANAGAAAAVAAAKQQSSKSVGASRGKSGGNKPWETDSLSSDSSSSSTSSSSSSYTSSSESEEVEKEKEKATTVANQKTFRAAQGPPEPPPLASKPGFRLTEEQIKDPFRTRPKDLDQHSIASSTMSRPEVLPLYEKVDRFEKKMAGGRPRATEEPLPPPRNPMIPMTRSQEQPPTVPARNAHYENTAQAGLGGKAARNPRPKPRGGGSSAESVTDTPQHSAGHRRHRRRSEDSDEAEEEELRRRRHHGHRDRHGAKRRSAEAEEVFVEDERRFAERHGRHSLGREDHRAQEELHYASSQMELFETTPQVPPQFANEYMVRDADRKLEQEVRRRSMDTTRHHGEEYNGEPDSVLLDTTSGTLTRQRMATGPRPDDPKRSSLPYRESDDEEMDNLQADRGRFAGRLNSLFKKKDRRLGEKDRRGPTSRSGTIQARGMAAAEPAENPHRRSQSVDARTRKERRQAAQSSESLLHGSRNTRARSSDRRPRTPVGFGGGNDDYSDEDNWQPTMTDDELDSIDRRRSTGNAFYEGPPGLERPLRNAKGRAQSEDFLGQRGSGRRPRDPAPTLPSRESAAYFDYESDETDSDFDSPRIERGNTGGYVNLPPPRHGRSKSYDVLQDAARPPKGRDDGLPGRLHRGYLGKSGPGSMASSTMSIGDVRGKDLGELERLLEHYMSRGRTSKARTLIQALILEDRNKLQQLLARLPGFREELQELCQRWTSEIGGERGGLGSDLLLSTLLLHGGNDGAATAQRYGNLMAAPSQATILRTVYMHPDDVEEPPPGMRPPPRPVPPALKKESLMSDELKRIDALAEELAINYDQTTFKQLMAVLLNECKTEVEKVRALYCWLTAKDLNRLDFDPYAPPESLLGMLRRVKYGEISYNDLFKRLCQYCGIHCEIIFGYSKGAGYRAGMNLKDTRMFESSWTAVYVANSWRFINVAWGSPRNRLGPMGETLGPASTGLGPGQRDEFYFLTDPEEHIFEHMPYQKRWQLMKRSITLEQFMSLPVLKSAFFNANLSLKKRYSGSLVTKEGRVTVRLVMPRFVGITCTLENRADMSELKGLTLVRVMGEEVAILATPSQPGRFYLNIFISSPDDWKNTTRTLAASFQIRCSEHNYDRLVVGRFPPVGFLGRTPAAQKFGVSVVGNPDPLLVWTEKDIVRIPLAVAPGLKLMHRLKCFERHGKDSRDCQEYALVQTRGKRTAYCLRCPADGYYYLTLYAGLVDSSDQALDPVAGSGNVATEGLECVHSFLVDCRRQMMGAPPFPLQSSRWNGCYLAEPTHRLLEVNRKFTFRLEAPHCSTVAVVVNGRNWLDLKRNKNGQWFGKIFTGEELGELSVYGRFSSQAPPPTRRSEDLEGFEDELDGQEQENYDKLLDFEIVMRHGHR